MKRKWIKRAVDETFKAMDLKGFGKHDVMELSMRTCVTKEREVFVSVEAVIQEPGKGGKCFKLRKDFDL